jgi:hypothetical protein
MYIVVHHPRAEDSTIVIGKEQDYSPQKTVCMKNTNQQRLEVLLTCWPDFAAASAI